ncbi:MAG: FAD-binding protein [Methanothrix sp.]|nr:FAD-binding protein [Methanothrix sp.]
MNDILQELKSIVGERASASPSERCCYASDASQIAGLPDFVVRPMNTKEVSLILRLCHDQIIPITARGAGTGLAGGCSPVKGGIVLDMSGMNRILEIDIENQLVIVEPGVVAEKLNSALKPHGLFFPPDPGSMAMCTIGGMISYNSSGMRSVKYGTVRNYVLDLEVVLADGQVIHTGRKVLKSSAGYDLTRLFVGSEGTLGIITRAGLKIAPLPKTRKLVLAFFDEAETAGQAVIRVFSRGITPSACEILDKTTLQVLKLCDPMLAIAEEGDLILFEVDGTEGSTNEAAIQIFETCQPLARSVRIVTGQQMQDIWAARRLVGAAISRLDPKKTRIYMGEDVGVPIKKIPALIKKVQQIAAKIDIPAMKYGHIGDGNLHVALFIDVMDDEQWNKLFLAADKIHRAALELGGTVSSEHGIGLARAEYLPEQMGLEAFSVMQSIKNALDPQGILNPGKMGL